MVRGGGQQFGKQAAPLRLRSRFRIQGDGVRRGGQRDVGPDGTELFFHLRRGELPELGEWEHLEPDQQRLRRGRTDGLAVQLCKSAAEFRKGRGEAPALLLGPDMVRLKAQSGLEAGVVAWAGEFDFVEPGERVKAHEFTVDANSGIAGFPRNDPRDGAHDRRGGEGDENADPLVPLLHIKASEVFIAFDGVPDALPLQLGIVQVDPLGRKLRAVFQQRHEVSRQREGAPGGFCSDDLLRGDADDAEIGIARHGGAVEDFVQY